MSNTYLYQGDVDAAIEAVLGPDRPSLEPEWAAIQLARSRGATLTMVDGRLAAADGASLEILTQALKDVAVRLRIGADEFIQMTPADRVAYLRAAAARGAFYGPPSR